MFVVNDSEILVEPLCIPPPWGVTLLRAAPPTYTVPYKRNCLQKTGNLTRWPST